MVKQSGSKRFRSDRKPSAKARAYPCGDAKCPENVLVDGIQCDDCGTWFHKKCSKLSGAVYNLHCRYDKLQWTCPACKQILKDLCTSARLQNYNPYLSAEHPYRTPVDSGNPVNVINQTVEVDSRTQENKSPTPSHHKYLQFHMNGRTEPNQNLSVCEMDVQLFDKTMQEQIGETINSPRTKRKKKKKISQTQKDKASISMKEVENRLEDLESRILQKIGLLDAEIQKNSTSIGKFTKLSEVATGRNRNVVVYGIPEPYMREGKQRDRTVRFHLINLLRIAELPGHVAIKRVLRLGRWQNAQEKPKPRPVLVEFANPRHRDHFLAATGTIQSSTKGGINIVPDDQNLARGQNDKKISSPGADRADGRTGGGAIILIAQHYGQSKVTSLITANVQAVGLTLKVEKHETRIACIYRSPNSSQTEDEELLNYIREQVHTNGNLIVMGDFNAPEIKWPEEHAPPKTFGASLLKVIHDQGLFQHTEGPTRWRDGQEPSTLDLVISRAPNDVTHLTVEAPLGKSDHALLTFELRNQGCKPPDKYRRMYKKIDREALVKRAEQMNWGAQSDSSVHQQWSVIKQNIDTLTEEVAPLRKVHRKGTLPWWTSKAEKAQKFKSRAWARYRNSKGHQRFLQYQAARLKAQQALAQSRRKYEMRLAKNANKNPKAYYNYVQSRAALRRAVGNVRDESGKHATNSKEKAQSLFHYFEKVYQEDRGSDSKPVQFTFEFPEMEEIEITTEEVHSALSKLNTNKAAGPDGIHPAILKPLAG
ncbi:hypothetical protein B566_EDAN019182, partial [Ephemera danica]